MDDVDLGPLSRGQRPLVLGRGNSPSCPETAVPNLPIVTDILGGIAATASALQDGYTRVPMLVCKQGVQ